MSRVYVLVCDYVDVDGGTFDTGVIGVYENYNGAKKEMEKMMKETLEDFEDYDIEQSEYAEGDISWSIWEKGEYASHHCNVFIQCKKVE